MPYGNMYIRNYIPLHFIPCCRYQIIYYIYKMLVDAHMEMHYYKNLFEILCVIFMENETD
jgi:hypothetical protein